MITKWPIDDAAELEPFDEDDGALMTIEEFRTAVACNSFIDYDGMGSWATATHYLPGAAHWIYPSQFKDSPPPKWATHVLWFNK